MRLALGIGAATVLLLGCTSSREGSTGAAGPSLATGRVAAAAPSAPVTAAPTVGASATAVASAAPRPSAEPPPKPLTEEEQFWFDLGIVFNAEIPDCKTGWTGDGRIQIQKGRITWFTIEEVGVPPRPLARLVGKATPPVPASLRKELEAGTSIAVCTGSARNRHE